jgi:hypothetical protein
VAAEAMNRTLAIEKADVRALSSLRILDIMGGEVFDLLGLGVIRSHFLCLINLTGLASGTGSSILPASDPVAGYK